jgi:O-antigen ligase
VSIEATTPATQTATTTARTRTRVGTVALWTGGLALLAAPAVFAFFSGGYGLPPGEPGSKAQLVGTAVALAFVAVLAVVLPWPLVRRGLPLLALATLVGLGVWTALSTGWTQILDTAVQDSDRLALYCACFGLALLVLRVPALRRIAPELLLLGVLVVSVYALAGRLLPDIVEQKVNSTRLSQPLTYWNALGIFTGFGVLLGAAIAGDESRGRLWRALACAAAVPCGVAAFLTLSRGVVAAVLAGLVVAVALRRGRATAIAAACVLLPVVALALATNAFPEVLEQGDDRSAQVSQGAKFLVLLVAGTVAAGIGCALLARARVAAGELPLPAGARTVAAILAVPLVLGVAVAISSQRTEKTVVPKTASRFTRAETNRGHYWRVSLRAFGRHPVNGVGSGSFAAVWARERGDDQPALDAHSLYLETLTELGLVGALLLVTFAGAVVAAVVRAARAGPRDPMVAASAAVLAAFAVHAGLDWDWEMPAVSLIPLILAAAVLQPRIDP